MESFEKEAKKRNLSEYYYRILDVLIAPSCEPIQSLDGDEEEDSDSSESADDTKVTRT